MWARNLLFIGCCIVGAGALAYNLLPSQRIDTPSTYQPKRTERDDFRNVVQKVDAEFAALWDKEGLEHAKPADELLIARRLSLGLTGAVPSFEEVRALQKVEEENRVNWFVSRLLEDRRFADHVAERFTRSYVGTENGPFIAYRRRRFTTWLSDRLYEQDMQYDEIVRELIAGRGLWTDSPQVNFITRTMNEDEGNQPDDIKLAARTVRAFLGTRIDCLQCHDEYRFDGAVAFPDGEGDTRDGEQKDFHQLAAFFAEAESGARGIQDTGKDPYKVKFLDDEDESEVEPGVPFNQDLLDEDIKRRRERLAAWVTHRKNKPFARTVVNRTWAIMTGKPLHDPIDNIPLEGSKIPGMETLADDLIEHDFDLRRLIRIIAATRAFQIDSFSDEFEPTAKHEQAWAVFPLTRLRPEQMSGSVVQSASLTTIDANSHIVWQLAKFAQTNDFINRYGDAGEDEFEERGGTTTQRLQVMNGTLVHEKTKGELFNAVTRIAMLAPTDEKAIDTAYLTLLTRHPTGDEKDHFIDRLKGKKGNQRNQVIQDMYWAIINSTEFAWNH